MSSIRVAIQAQVRAVTPMCRAHTSIELLILDFPASEPGQFLQLKCAAERDAVSQARTLDWPDDGFPSLARANESREQPFLRRPFSIADRWNEADGAHVLVISRSVGTGTRWIEHLRAGDRVDLTGPLGRGFIVPPAGTPIILAGGGVGIPPLLYLARRLHESGHRDVTAVFGATARELLPAQLIDEPAHDGTPLPCVELPGGAEFPTIISSDDGSIGVRGFVTDGLIAYESHHKPAACAPVVLACGPEPMLRAVAKLTHARGWGCQICLERYMACGLGTCLSCIVRVRDENAASGWRWAVACKDGPVFERDDLFDYGETVAG